MKYWCGRCGVNKTEIKGHTCQSCKDRQEENAQMWKNLKCSTCGKQAVGYHINGAFCSNEHYSPPKDKRFEQFSTDKMCGFIIKLDGL